MPKKGQKKNSLMNIKKIMILLWLTIVSAAVLSCKKEDIGTNTIYGETTVTGTITYDDGKPASGIMVSDGFKQVRTDASGKYTFERTSGALYVYYSIPADAKIELGSNGLPCFYTKLNRTVSEYNFTLQRQSVETRFRMLALGDPQVKTTAQINRFTNETIADIKAYTAKSDVPCYAITLGDIVGNTWDLYSSIAKAMDASKAGVPIFQTIGNHDHEFPSTSDTKSKKAYENTFGPSIYSFERGNVHFISADDVLHEATASTSYDGGFDDEKWQWIQKDLEKVSREKAVVLCVHIPPKAGSAFATEGHYDDLVNLLSEFAAAYIIAGHTHNNVTNWEKTVNGKLIHEFVTGTTCGAWWHGTICTDGTPCGYGSFLFDGPQLVNQIYKATKYDEGFQYRLYRASDFPSFKWNDGSTETTIKFPVTSSSSIMVNAWNATPAWQWEVWEDGVKTNTVLSNTSLTTKYYDVWAKKYYYDIEHLTSSSYNGKYNHMLYFTLKNSEASTITLKATDQWGNTFENSTLTTNLPKDQPSGY